MLSMEAPGILQNLNERNKKPHPSFIHVKFSTKNQQNIERAFYNLPTQQKLLA
jgi:hypothetical protein